MHAQLAQGHHLNADLALVHLVATSTVTEYHIYIVLLPLYLQCKLKANQNTANIVCLWISCHYYFNAITTLSISTTALLHMCYAMRIYISALQAICTRNKVLINNSV